MTTKRRSSYDPTPDSDTNLALAQVLNGGKTYWSRNGATVRYFHEPLPAWSWSTPDGDCGVTNNSDDAFIAIAAHLG